MNKLITLFIILILTYILSSKANAAIPKLDVTQKHNLSRFTKEHLKKEIIIAVIDTGVDIKHPDLQDNLWSNPGEQGLDENGNLKVSNQIDDDSNGYIDDVYGWNFSNNNNDLTDIIGHGTHISGILAGKSAPRIKNLDTANLKVMSLKYFDKNASDEENMDYTVQAIHYAIKMGAQIINYSSSGVVKSAKEEAAIQEASKKGILFITAAGNSGLNLDKYNYYPANYKVKNILSVAAVDENFKVLKSSNYGQQTLLAPGKAIYSTLPGGTYGKMTGTSQATAYAAQTIAELILNSRTPNSVTEDFLQAVKQKFNDYPHRLQMN